jgi:hypothetical protein
MTIRRCYVVLGVILAIGSLNGILQGKTPPPPVEESTCFYLRSLHFTAKGMEHWYSKQNGGLESHWPYLEDLLFGHEPAPPEEDH